MITATESKNLRARVGIASPPPPDARCLCGALAVRCDGSTAACKPGLPPIEWRGYNQDCSRYWVVAPDTLVRVERMPATRLDHPFWVVTVAIGRSVTPAESPHDPTDAECRAWLEIARASAGTAAEFALGVFGGGA
jgi:hypothetical protein